MIWATVSQSCFCWWYRASPSLDAKNIIYLISVLTIWWCPCVESSLVGRECLLWPVHSLGKTLLAFHLLRKYLLRTWQHSKESACSRRNKYVLLFYLTLLMYLSPLLKWDYHNSISVFIVHKASNSSWHVYWLICLLMLICVEYHVLGQTLNIWRIIITRRFFK